MTTFSVDSVKRSKTPLEEVDWREYVADDLQAEPDGLFRFPEYLFPAHVRTNNKFVGAVHQAYEGHYPLVLSPDIIWQCVAQGFAVHVNQNAERLRHLFVKHKGKRDIVVIRDSFVKGSQDNDWEGALESFSQDVREHIGDEIHSILTPAS